MFSKELLLQNDFFFIKDVYTGVSPYVLSRYKPTYGLQDYGDLISLFSVN